MRFKDLIRNKEHSSHALCTHNYTPGFRSLDPASSIPNRVVKAPGGRRPEASYGRRYKASGQLLAASALTSQGLGGFLGLGMNISGLKAAGYLEGHGDLVSRLITPISHIITPIIPIIDVLTKSQ